MKFDALVYFVASTYRFEDVLCEALTGSYKPRHEGRANSKASEGRKKQREAKQLKLKVESIQIL